MSFTPTSNLNTIPKKHREDITSDFFSLIGRYFSPKNRFLHLAGPNLSGKSTIIKEFIRYDIRKSSRRYFIIDSEQKFSIRNYMHEFSSIHQNRIFVNNSQNFTKITATLNLLQQDVYPLESNDIVIIDSISNILKRELGNGMDYYDNMKALKYISEKIVPALIDLVVDKHLFVILSHHVTYHPGYNTNIPYYFDLMMSIAGMWIYLHQTPKGVKDKSFQYDNFLTLSFTFTKEKQNHLVSETNIRQTYRYLLKDGKVTILLEDSL
ncbi:ATP-binding protein [Promethearchaeum syntrophicum]|uniref:ATP-binding protein n=1 Tax=Promethearchaeum syntrophicum TaxID=2594042 RepID=A0A5B9DBS6_9ARCH|nr:ATP-binding protein [Candidatus Prometheoarchaeum syntrophicum]QEE16307.1 hypothetical protein DSAG12_02137 [Candidatus Prometheoarchaeum syntrophicum]